MNNPVRSPVLPTRPIAPITTKGAQPEAANTLRQGTIIRQVNINEQDLMDLDRAIALAKTDLSNLKDFENKLFSAVNPKVRLTRAAAMYLAGLLANIQEISCHSATVSAVVEIGPLGLGRPFAEALEKIEPSLFKDLDLISIPNTDTPIQDFLTGKNTGVIVIRYARTVWTVDETNSIITKLKATVPSINILAVVSLVHLEDHGRPVAVKTTGNSNTRYVEGIYQRGFFSVQREEIKVEENQPKQGQPEQSQLAQLVQ